MFLFCFVLLLIVWELLAATLGAFLLVLEKIRFSPKIFWKFLCGFIKPYYFCSVKSYKNVNEIVKLKS